jgi:hypothetical protein
VILLENSNEWNLSPAKEGSSKKREKEKKREKKEEKKGDKLSRIFLCFYNIQGVA